MDKVRGPQFSFLLLLSFGITFMCGCTAADRDYVRQHIVQNEAGVVQEMSLRHGVAGAPFHPPREQGSI